MEIENKGIAGIESLKNHYHNINCDLLDSFEEPVLSPILGVIVLRRLLERFNINIPLLFDLDKEGHEFIIEIDKSGNFHDLYDTPQNDCHYLYVIYVKEDSGKYLFHSEITDLDGIEDILNEKDEEDSIEDV